MTRLLDFFGAATGLLVLSPLFALVAVAVKLTSPGPVFYRARRVGRGGVEFAVLKFRSMRVGGDEGPAITSAGDPRVTPLGRLLRKNKVDELPQLINVLKGEMSLVGPRPEDARYVAMYDAEQRRILDVRPGITSPASLAFRFEEEQLVGPDAERIYIERFMPQKLGIDLEYLRRRTILTDLCILFRTIGAMIR